MIDILMPRLGLTMETGTIVAWHVKEGEEFKQGQALFDVESDKLTNSVEARFDGILKEILVEEYAECDVAAVVARVEKIGE